MQNENWQDEAHRRLGDPLPRRLTEAEVEAWRRALRKAFAEQSVWHWPLTPPPAKQPAWQLKLVEIREEELEGLDRAGFRDLVRRKLQGVGDDLLAAWEARNGN